VGEEVIDREARSAVGEDRRERPSRSTSGVQASAAEVCAEREAETIS
jgi:hypothetical protein